MSRWQAEDCDGGPAHGLPEPMPLLVVLSGPSGVGKDAVLNELKKTEMLHRLEGDVRWHFMVTATTRPQRHNEVNGVDYHFVTRQQFEDMIQNDEFLEWASVYGNLYGVPRSQAREALAMGLDVFVKTDVQGAATIRRLAPEAVLVFVVPPSMDELEVRLRRRQTEREDSLRLRLETARQEMGCLTQFDYAVVNHDGQIDQVVSRIEAILTSEKCRVRQRTVRL